MTTVRDNAALTTMRPAEDVLSGRDMNGAWATRHSFARTMLRRASAHGWTISRNSLRFDEQARGEAHYTVTAEGREFQFVAFSRTLEESERTDRVIASSWDVTAALLEGELTPERAASLRSNVPLQERGRMDSETLILTRANRSARFFDYVSDCLARGEQPEVEKIGPSPYLIRSTAFYGNGKFGLKQFAALPAGHPLAVPYRSQMLAAWMLRELSMDMAEHVARAKAQNAGTTAVPLNKEWGRYMGLGNATGLGMVPFVINHPEYLDAWCRLRELPLAASLARSYGPDDPDLESVAGLLRRALRHLAEKDSLATEPFLPAWAVRLQLDELLESLLAYMSSPSEPTPVLARLHETASALSSEARGIFASAVTELRSDFDEDLERLLTTGEPGSFDPAMTCGQMRNLLEQQYAWVLDLDFSDPRRTGYYWFSSESNEEPRRALRSDGMPSTVEHCTDIARRISAMAEDLRDIPANLSLGDFLIGHPRHRFAAARAQQTRALHFGELQQNLLDADFLPLSTQRFQLACYGMNNFSPQSTDWLRVTLFSGAPRAEDVNNATAGDDWLFPTAPNEPGRP